MKPIIRYSSEYGWYVCVYYNSLTITMWRGDSPCAAYEKFAANVYG